MSHSARPLATSLAVAIAVFAPAAIAQQADVTAKPAPSPAPSADAAPSQADALAKQLSNPLAALISVPLQLNYDDGVGPNDAGNRTQLKIQPVIPVSISENWNMISRTILPIVSQHDIYPGAGTQNGLGDTSQSFFFSPKAPTKGGWVLGIGPALLIPTATDDLLGSGKWGAGPTAVALHQGKTGWTIGALVSQTWSFAGSSDRASVNSMYLQPFVAKALGKGRTLSLNAESTYDWDGDQWTVPLNFTYSQVSRLGKQLVSWQGGVRYYVDGPQSAAQWGLRFQLTLLYPRK